MEDIDNVSKFKDTLKQIKQSSGVLQQDAQPGTTIINVGNVKEFMLKVRDNRSKTLQSDRLIDQTDNNCHLDNDNDIPEAETIE